MIIFLVLVIGLAVGGEGTYYYFEVRNKPKCTTTNKSKEESAVKKDTTDDGNLNLEGMFIQNLVNQYDDNTSDKSGKLEIFTADQFQQTVSRMFGTNFNLPNKTIDYYGCGSKLEYSEESKSYKYVELEGCGGISSLSLERKVINVKTSEDQLEIKVAVAFIDHVENKVYKVYNYAKDNKYPDNSSSAIEGMTAENLFENDNYKKLEQYTYQYRYDTKNNIYYLESIELVK